MAQIIVRGIEEDVKQRLQKRAARHGRSMEAEVRDILRNTVRCDEQAKKAGTKIAERFKGKGIKKDDIKELRGYTLKNPFED